MKGILFMLLALFFSAGLFAAEKIVCVTRNRAQAPQGAIVAISLQKGIDQAGRLRRQGHDVTLLIAGGSYVVDKTLEMTARELGTSGGSLLVCPLNGQQVTLRGGMEIPLRFVEPAPANNTRIRPEVRDKIVRVDLRKAGVKEIGRIRNAGFSRPALPAWSEVFVNDKVQRLSRWPNDTMALMGPVIETGSIPRVGDMTNRGGSFTYSDDRPADWTSGEPRWIAGYFAHGYADDMVRIASINTREKTITLAEAVMYGLISGSDFNRWYVVNLLEEVDRPGEYYMDEDNMTLWLYPSEDIRTMSVSLLAEPMMAIEGVQNVEIRDMGFTGSRGMGVYMEQTENVVLRGCLFHNLGSMAVCMGRGIEPFKQYSHASDLGTPVSRMVGSLGQHLYQDTAYDGLAGHNNSIVDCIITEVGAGGVILQGGNPATQEPGGNYVQNCRISNYNRVEKSYRPAINIIGVGNRVSHCEIFDAPSSAIMFAGNDHLIEYNEIYNVCKEVDDLGAIYYGRNPAERGNKLMYNYVHDLSAKHRVTGFYFDDGSCGMTVIGNILYKAGRQPVLLGGGSDHYFENNMFIGTPYGMYVDNRLMNWQDNEDTRTLFRKRLEAVHYQKSPYKDKYPEAARYFEEDYRIPKRNKARNNLYYDISQLLICPGERPFERAYLEMQNCWMTWSGKGFENPGFVDVDHENWNLKPDAAVFRQIPGFRAIPFDEIGCSLPN